MNLKQELQLLSTKLKGVMKSVGGIKQDEYVNQDKIMSTQGDIKSLVEQLMDLSYELEDRGL